MSITIIQKSNLSVRKRDPKTALVLAGGAVSGGAFKLGGLKALDDFLINKKTTDFDIYVGLSAGALLSAPLAAGVPPPEALRALSGSSDQITHFGILDFYNPNVDEFLSKPVEYVLDALTFFPRTVLEVLGETPDVARQVGSALDDFRRAPGLSTIQRIARPLVRAVSQRELPLPHNYLPAGLCDNSTIEKYIRENLERNGIPNDFHAFKRQTGKELYVCAMNLDTAEQAIFGPDRDDSVSISQAVQASTALPGFYRPARINGVDYVDGAVRRTANIDVAIEQGAELIICYNPFRPFSNRVVRKFDEETGRYAVKGEPLADGGMLSVFNQVFRTLLHTRLQYGIKQFQEDTSFRGDIIVIEPAETDTHMFGMNPLALWDGPRAGRHGYTSVSHSIDAHYDVIKRILLSYGILMTRREIKEGLEKMRGPSIADANEYLLRDVPRRELGVV